MNSRRLYTGTPPLITGLEALNAGRDFGLDQKSLFFFSVDSEDKMDKGEGTMGIMKKKKVKSGREIID